VGFDVQLIQQVDPSLKASPRPCIQEWFLYMFVTVYKCDNY